MSDSASATLTEPMIFPELASGLPTVAVPVGGVLAGLTATATGTTKVPPWPSVAVTVKESARAEGGAPSAAALCRAVALGV